MAKISAFEQAKNALQNIISAPGNAIKKWWNTPVVYNLGGPGEQVQAVQGNSPAITPTPQPTVSPWGMAPTPSPWPQATPTPVATQGGGLDLVDLENKIRAGFGKYGSGSRDQGTVDIGQYIPQMVDAAKRYSFFRNNPYLLPQIAIRETSAGRNITRPNNLLNWGINYPGNNEAFSKMSIADVLERAISGLGERDPNYVTWRNLDRPMTEQEANEFGKKYSNSEYGDFYSGMQSFGQ